MDKKDLAEMKVVVSEAMNEVLEHVVMPQFDQLHERIDKVEANLNEVKQEVIGLKNQSATKGWVEDRLDNFRIDHGLTYKPAA